METLVAVARHRNYGSRGQSYVADGFIPSPSIKYRGISCRTFHSVGVLPAPSYRLDSFACTKSRKQRPSPVCSELPMQPRRSNPICVSPRPPTKGIATYDEVSDSERWAGPAYSNSPPPSSLPLPNFSLRQKRSVSLELPISRCEIETEPLARSAPSSPVRDLSSSSNELIFDIDSATQDLRKILHLDCTDD